MEALIPSSALVRDIELSEREYMYDRMTAIQNRIGNPEGIEIVQFGSALCLYSKTMPWGTFNTVKGITSHDLEYIQPIINFYQERQRKIQFEVVPSIVDAGFLKMLSDHGFYQTGVHTSTVMEPRIFDEQLPEHICIHELNEDQFETYAMIHCRGTGLPDDGIAPVAANNKVLLHRPGWKFFMAYVHDEPAAVAVMYSNHAIASLTFAATLPAFRGIGLHQFLLKRRIEEAKRNDCRLVVGQCSFLSQSHRNMERVGMKIGYIRTTWTNDEGV
ncbi:GNAT family N-acetyltransferase [Paenibacillus lemnae]|uniref:GNAT family N-acetyltransferase n=1 Tax=Paenibacillus lemnae TaxID=1330551 RepID=A0A848MAK3_PAELE|nr:GNAT family N-acetyltransferase [Paenibacillus lemnae]NMO97695.1 GNAT family N-acetyltransferase [Paenibacillus lemnae]